MKHFKFLLSVASLAVLLSFSTANASIMDFDNVADTVNGGFLENDSLGSAQGIGDFRPGGLEEVLIESEGTGQSSFDYYTFNVEAGQTLIFNLFDTRNLDGDLIDTEKLYLKLFDGNDDFLGENIGFDPYLAYEFAADYGFTTATIGVGDAVAGIFFRLLPDYVGYSLNISTVPEPSIIALFAIGLLGLGFAGRRRKS